MRHWNRGSAALLAAAAILLLSGCGGALPKQEASLTEKASEAATEQMTEQLPFRPIREVMDEDTLAWAEGFDAARVEKLVYTNWGEDKSVYEVTDAGRIRAFFEALMGLTVAGRVDMYAQDAGDTYDFCMKDGQVVRFEFNMASLLVEDQIYETDQSDRLWELTGKLIPADDVA